MKIAERAQRYVTKVTEAYRAGGLKNVLTLGAGTFRYLLGRYFFDYSRFLLLKHSGADDRILPAQISITAKVLDESSLADVARLLGAEPGSRLYRRLQMFFSSGNECFGAIHDGALICTGWGLHQEDHYRAYDLRVQPNRSEVVLSGGFTAPQFRGMHVREFLLGYQIAYFRARGLRCIVAIQSSNKASLRVFSRYSFERYGVIRKLRVLGIKIR
jgi:GNAT superfamily N-acetyltransferase